MEPRQLLLLLVGLGLALHSVRNLSFFMLVAVPALADYAQQARERLSLRWPRRVPRTTPITFAANVVMIVLILAIVAVVRGPHPRQRVDGPPVARDLALQAAALPLRQPPPRDHHQVYWRGGCLHLPPFT